MDHGKDDQIRRRAHEIWEQEGRPHGKETEHWERATRELEDGSVAPAEKKRRAAPRTAGAAKPVAAKKAPARTKS